jgi:hypothetical protein
VAGAYDPNAVIFELVQIGGSVKVTAIDPASFTEVTTIGSPRVSETELKRLARRKLEYVLNKKSLSN